MSLIGHIRAISIPNPLRGCNSDLARYSNTPTFHHSARPDSRTRTTTRTRTKRLVSLPCLATKNCEPRTENCKRPTANRPPLTVYVRTLPNHQLNARQLEP